MWGRQLHHRPGLKTGTWKWIQCETFKIFFFFFFVLFYRCIFRSPWKEDWKYAYKTRQSWKSKAFVCAEWSRIETDSCSPPGQADFRKKIYIRMEKMVKAVTAQSPGVFSPPQALFWKLLVKDVIDKRRAMSEVLTFLALPDSVKILFFVLFLFSIASPLYGSIFVSAPLWAPGSFSLLIFTLFAEITTLIWKDLWFPQHFFFCLKKTSFSMVTLGHKQHVPLQP